MIGADVGGRAFAANVLLAGRKRQAKRPSAFTIDGLADQTARHLAHVGETAGEKTKARAAELQRHPETLSFTDGDIDAECARRFEDAERQRFCRDGDREPTGTMREG